MLDKEDAKVFIKLTQAPAIIRLCSLRGIYYAQVACATFNRGSKRFVRFIIGYKNHDFEHSRFS